MDDVRKQLRRILNSGVTKFLKERGFSRLDFDFRRMVGDVRQTVSFPFRRKNKATVGAFAVEVSVSPARGPWHLRLVPPERRPVFQLKVGKEPAYV